MIKYGYDEENKNYYFVDEKGNKSSERYAYASPYYCGFALVQKELGKGYYFRNEAGKLSQKFNDASSFDEYGFAVVKRTKNSRWQYIDTNFNINEQTFDYAGSYQEGFARVKEDKCLKFHFRDLQGNISEDGYGGASDYKEGFACVSENYLSPGKNWYRDLNGNLSEPFRVTLDYKDGYGIVSLLDEPDKFRLRDKYGNVSQDSYYSIDNGQYSTTKPPVGFFIVKEAENSPSKYRDFLGNLTDKPTKKGSDYYYYIKDKKDLFELDTTCFGDDKFLKIIMEKEQSLLMQASEHCKTEEDMKKLAELAEFTGDYIRNEAYEAQVLAKEEAKKQKFEKQKKDLQSQIQKMF